MLRFRDFGVFVFDLGCFVFEIWVLPFRVLGASFSSFGCFVFAFWVLRASVFVFECFVFETTRDRDICNNGRRSNACLQVGIYHIQSKRKSHFTNAKTLTLKIQYTITLSHCKSYARICIHLCSIKLKWVTILGE